MKAKPRLAFLLIVLFQVLILAGLTGFNEVSLATGDTVVLQTGPVDPRDIFRGDYVVLRYEISTLVNTPGVWMLKQGDKAYVRLERDGDVWDAVEVSNVYVDGWAAFIAGEVTSVSNDRATIIYGIEAYFVPEGEGLAIQRAADIKVRAKIDASGKAVIENLIVDGKTYEL